MRILAIADILLSISLSACVVVPFAETNTIRLHGTLVNTVSVSVIIDKAKIDEDFHYDKPVWWGTELELPETITGRLTVSLNGNPRWVPFSAYSDLANVTSANLVVLENGFQIVIDGGESSTHYIANLYFDSEGFLTSRKVHSPSFPDEVWEETTYSFIRRPDM